MENSPSGTAGPSGTAIATGNALKNLRTFSIAEIDKVTDTFKNRIGEGGFGPVFMGLIDNRKIVAVKRLNWQGDQCNKEYDLEIRMLSNLRHPNIIDLIGCCADGNVRILVYEFMHLGSLDSHLHDLAAGNQALDWNTRMRIATGVARALNYLHTEANPPVIFRDLKPSNILLDESYNPKLSDFGTVIFGPIDDNPHITCELVGTPPYWAPEYRLFRRLTYKSDVYSFGVLLLEIITAQPPLDETRGDRFEYLADWLHPQLREENFVKLVDPQLNGRFPQAILSEVMELASRCINEFTEGRPSMSEVVDTMTRLTYQQYDPQEITESSSIGNAQELHLLPWDVVVKSFACSNNEHLSAGSRFWLGPDSMPGLINGKLKGQEVSVKHLYFNDQCSMEFVADVGRLFRLRHPNVAELFGYSVDEKGIFGIFRSLIYKRLPMGSLELYLHGHKPENPPLDWNSRMRVAMGVARALSYLHTEANPPFICSSDFSSSNILLDEGYKPTICCLGVAKYIGPFHKSLADTVLVGTPAYWAPEYGLTKSGKLTMSSDTFAFGVLLLEIISGQKPLDESRGDRYKYLADWLRPKLREDSIADLVDPQLKGRFRKATLIKVMELAKRCIREYPFGSRPSMGEVVEDMNNITSQPYDPNNADDD